MKTHVNRAMMRLGERDRAHLVVFAYEADLVRPGWASWTELLRRWSGEAIAHADSIGLKVAGIRAARRATRLNVLAAIATV